MVAFPAAADFVTFSGAGSGDGSNGLAAEATFTISGNTLTVLLTNTSTDFSEIPSESLTGVYFDFLNGNILTGVSAVVAAGSTVVNGVSGPGGDVGGEFAYLTNIASGFNGASYGISSSGMDDVFGPGDRFNNNDLDAPDAPNGMNYGLISAAGLGPNANLAMLSEPFIQNAVLFSFTFSGALSTDDISNVSFQYGTSQSQPNITTSVVPEPATLAR
jgi:hypothetical protein